jgi:F-type H+-transporting ATPase subunit c
MVYLWETEKQTHNTINHMLTPILAELTGNVHVALAAVGAAIGIGLLGAKAAEATGRNPGAAGNILTLSIILAALIEGIVFFAIFLAR